MRVAVFVSALSGCAAYDNGVGRTPPMGWMSWNAFHRHWDEELLVAVADEMASNGMQKAGYEYISVDGGWWESENHTIVRNASGFPTWSSSHYPKLGLPKVVEYIQGKGFKYGHYTDAGRAACDGDGPMSEGFEEQDVALFVHDWHIDMIKIDACNTEEDSYVLVKRWHDLLNATGRPVYLTNCHNGCMTADGELPDWCPQLLNGWRVGRDIRATWKKMLDRFDMLKGRGANGRPGAWNDPDALECHVGEFLYNGTEVSMDMNRAHFSMWAITSSPLVASPDLRETPQEIINIFTDEEAIAVDQQYVSNAGDFLRVASNGTTEGEIWTKPLPGGAAAVLLLNRDGQRPLAPVTFDFHELPGLWLPESAAATTCSVRNIWEKKQQRHSGNYSSSTIRRAAAEFLLVSNCSGAMLV